MKIALLQILPGKTLDENLELGIKYCRAAKDKGADLALFPEMWSNGYNVSDTVEALREQAVPAHGEFTAAFASLANELDMAIGITLLEEYEPSPRNTLILFDRHGNELFSYSKVHTCDFDVECNLTRGDDFCVAQLDTSEGTVTVGAMICYDREFPESARVLMLKGAELILVPNACPMEINRLEQLRSRAFENMLAVATCNYPEGQPDCNGRSTVFDGVAWPLDYCGARDMCILKAGGEAGIYIADLDLALLRAYRNNEVFGNAFRRPDKYGEITKNGVDEPFIRAKRRD